MTIARVWCPHPSHVSQSHYCPLCFCCLGTKEKIICYKGFYSTERRKISDIDFSCNTLTLSGRPPNHCGWCVMHCKALPRIGQTRVTLHSDSSVEAVHEDLTRLLVSPNVPLQGPVCSGSTTLPAWQAALCSRHQEGYVRRSEPHSWRRAAAPHEPHDTQRAPLAPPDTQRCDEPHVIDAHVAFAGNIHVYVSYVSFKEIMERFLTSLVGNQII